MSKEPFYRESEESWAERHRRVVLLPGQEICDCGAVTEPDERHKCAHCGHKGCEHCMRLADDTGHPEINDTWVCDEDECEIGYLEELARYDEQEHRKYQDFIARQVEAVRLRKAG